MTDAISFEPTTVPEDLSLAIEKNEGSLQIATEKLPGRHRRISATISIPCPVEQVWHVLTDYENLADFIPNLTVSRKLEGDDSRTLLEQVGSQCFLNIQFCARVVLDMVEQFPNSIGFTMVEGDFKTFEGVWKLQKDDAGDGLTRLVYDITICPPRAVPAVLIERHLRHDLTQNLQAIRRQAIAVAGLT
jgi:ribosome-associated toxin RatA of RatAB toxin-antitoxin module